MLNKMRFFQIAVVILYWVSTACAGEVYHYEVIKDNQRLIHVVHLDQAAYESSLVRAGKRGRGRETVAAMASRVKADVAINGGFFHIGHGKDGRPSGSLVINGKIYGLKNKIQPILIINNGKLSIQRINPKQFLAQKGNARASIVSGIPLLIKDGRVNQGLYSKSQSYTAPHARTAVGIKPNGGVVIVIAEHDPVLMGTRGLSLLELAQLMEKLGCHSAINLDGGGSSTLWVKGRVINRTLGDVDEFNGIQAERPVSDAIIFKVKHKK